MPGFRFQAVQTFLTYSQAQDAYPTLDDFYNALKSAGFFSLVQRGVVGKEPHATCGHHYHVYIAFSTKLRHTDQSYFDLGGIHPNISPVSNAPAISRVRAYCKKGGEFIEWGDWDIKLDWCAIWKAETENEFWALVEKHKPEAIKSYNSLKAFAKDKFAIKDKPYVAPNVDFNVPVGMDSWYEDVLQVKR